MSAMLASQAYPILREFSYLAMDHPHSRVAKQYSDLAWTLVAMTIDHRPDPKVAEALSLLHTSRQALLAAVDGW